MWAKYVKDTSGQFAIMFSVLAVFLLGLIGVAIDVTTIHSAKQKYQDLSDAAVLAAAISGLEDAKV